MTIDRPSSGGRGRAATGASGATGRRLAAAAEDAASRWPLGRIIAAGMLALAVVLVAAIVVGAVALNNLGSDRNRVVSTLDPAAFRGSQLYAAHGQPGDRPAWATC